MDREAVVIVKLLRSMFLVGKSGRLLITALSLFFLPFSSLYAQTGDFGGWLDLLAKEAASQGVSEETLRRVLPFLSYDESVLELDRRQPEKTIGFETYLRNTISQARVNKGRDLSSEHKELLTRMWRDYGVPPSIVVSLWAVESDFGGNMGDYEVVNVLATLAYEGRRMTLFRKELVEALKILDENGMDYDYLKGSWAGAMGQCQFLPSTYRRYAVDGNGDGKRDIWNDEADIFFSIANYLTAEGWRSGEPWGFEVTGAKNIPVALKGLETAQSVEKWKKSGIRALNGAELPDNEAPASLIQPDGTGGRSFLVYDNFRALMRWNRSTYFATSVGLLADALDRER